MNGLDRRAQLTTKLSPLVFALTLVAGCGTGSTSDSGATSEPTASSTAQTTADGSGVLHLGGAAWSTKYGFGAAWVQVDPPIDQIVKIDAATETVSLAIDGGRSVAFTSDAVWVAIGGEELQKLDPETGEVLLAVPLHSDYLAAGHGSIWGPSSRGLTRIDDQTGEVQATITMPELGELTDVDVSDNAVWVTAKTPAQSRA